MVSTMVGTRLEESPEGIVYCVPPPEKKKLIEHEIAHYKAVIEAIQNESSQELLEKLRKAQRVRDRMVRSAELNLKRQLDNIDILYRHECDEAEAVFEASKGQVEDKHLSDIRERIRRMEEIRDGVGDVSERMTTRMLRSKAKVDFDDKGQSNGNNRKKRQSTMFPPLVKEVDEEEAMQDISAIESQIRKVQAMIPATRPTTVSVESGRLNYRGEIFSKGDAVIVRSELTKEDFFGTITSINSTEVYVRLQDGSKSRVYLTHLRNDRCSLSAQKKKPEDGEEGGAGDS